MAMMESDTNIVGAEKLLLETAMDGAEDSVDEPSTHEEVPTLLENGTGSALCQPVISEPRLIQINIPSIELPDSDAVSSNDQFENNCTIGHSITDLATAADEGFNEEKALHSEHSDDATGTDQSSGICSPNEMTPNSTEEPCHTAAVEDPNTADKMDSEEINDLPDKIDSEEINDLSDRIDSEEINILSDKKMDSEEINDLADKMDSEEINDLADKTNSEEVIDLPDKKIDSQEISDLSVKIDSEEINDLADIDSKETIDLPKKIDSKEICDLPDPIDSEEINDMPKKIDSEEISDLSVKIDSEEINDLADPIDSEETIDLPKKIDSKEICDFPDPIDSEEISDMPKKIDSEEISDMRCSDAGSKSPVSNKKLCDAPLSEVLSPSRRSNVFELPFLQTPEKLDPSFSIDDAKRSSAASPLMETVAIATDSVVAMECGAASMSVHSPMSDAEEFNGIQPIVITPVKSSAVDEDESNDVVRSSGVSFHSSLQNDAKLWCEAYVKLVDCANLLLLTMPSVITDAVAERKSPKAPKVLSPGKSVSPGKHSNDLRADSLFERIVKSETLFPSKSISPSKCSSDRGADSLFERIVKSEPFTPSSSLRPSSSSFSPSKPSSDLGANSSSHEQSRVGKSHASDANSLGDDTDSHNSDRGRKKRQQRSRKAPETKARKSRSKLQQRRIVFNRGKTNRKRSRDEDPDEVICKLDAWKKLHKSKAKASKQSSVNGSSSLASHELLMKQELVDGGLSIPSEYQLTSVSGDSRLAHVKTELVSDDANYVFTASEFGDQNPPPLPLVVEPKCEAADFGFAVVKQEPADDYVYTDNCDGGKFVDSDGITPLFPIGEVVSLASVQIQVLGACYSLNEILQDDYWQPSVVLKRFPIWILQNLQSLSEGYNADDLPQSEEVVDSWSNSFVSQGSLQFSNESVPFAMATGCNSESDSLTLKFDEYAAPPLSSIQLSFNSEDESSMKIDALPSDDNIAQPLTKRFKSGPASKVRGRKSNKVKEREKKENEEESASKMVTEDAERTEVPRRLSRPRRSSRIKPKIPEEESEKHVEKENARKIAEKEKPGEILSVETSEPTEKTSDVPAVEKKRKNEQRENISKADCAELAPKRGRTRRETVETKKLAENVDNVADRKRILKGRVDGKVPTVGEKVRGGDEKKSKPKLGFVIPKKRPLDPNASSTALQSATAQPKAGGASLVPSPASTLSRIPKLPKALSAEDKERSVLAKLDTEVGKREALKWDSRNSWTGKPTGTVNGTGGTDHQGVVGTQDKPLEENNWQRTVVDRFRLQNLKGREMMMHPLQPHQQRQQQRQPKVPLLGIAPGISAPGLGSISSEWNRCAANTMNQEWMMNSCGPGVGPPQNSAPANCFPSQPPIHRMDEQWPIPTVGYSIPVIQSSERLTNNNNAAAVQPGKWNCAAERDQTFGPLAEPALQQQQRSEPVLREVPYVKDASEEVFSCYGLSDDDFDDDDANRDRLQNGRSCESLASSSSAAVPQSFPLLGDPPLADNMDDSIRLFAEAVQEAIEQGDISSEKCDRLVNLYEKLCRDLIAEDVTENQQNAEAAGINCDTVNQTMHKELRLIKDLTKNQLTASAAASDLLRSFGNADKCSSSSSRGNGVDYARQKTADQMPCRGGGDEDSARHGKSLPPGCRAGNVSRSYSGDRSTSGGGSFDGRTNRSFAILQDDALWRDLLGQAQSPGMSEESLELLRRLLLEAAKRGVYDEQMVNMLNVVCQHIKLEDSKELSLRKEFRSGSAFQQSGRCSESVEIPFISEEQNFAENKGLLRKFRKQDSAQRCATPISPVLSSRSHEVHGMSDSESESGFTGLFLPSRVTGDKSAERIEQIRKKQEAFASKVLDEIRLLEMLVAIQCELAVVTPSGVPPVTSRETSVEPEGKSAKPVRPTEPHGLADPILPLVSPAGSSKAGDLSAAPSIQPAVEKASSESCDTPSLSSELLMCGHPSTSTAGDESQDSHSTQKSARSVKDKDTVIDKKSCDPKAIEEKVISMARNALKPHYHNGAITSEEFKLIMKKSIAKICKSRSTDISQKRITKFMNAYVEKVVQSRK